MDPYSAALDGHRARGASVWHAALREPWSIDVADHAPLALLVMRSGHGTIEVNDGRPAIELRAGDVAITSGGLRYTFADAAGRAPSIVIGPDERSRDLVGTDLCLELGHGVRRWGTGWSEDPKASSAASGLDEGVSGDETTTTFLVGTYGLGATVSERLVAALPGILVIRAEEATGLLAQSVPLLVAELDRDEPGQSVVIDRLLDLVLTAAIRQWFESLPAETPTWWSAHGDSVVGPVLRAMHEQPAEPWTLDLLARTAQVSRATLARRFAELVGTPPMTYLAHWRMDLAKELLRDSDASIEQVASRVGYASAFAFSAAFKKSTGASPRAFRVAERGSLALRA